MKRVPVVLAICLLSVLASRGQSSDPLTLVQTIEIPGVPEGHHTDHLAIDLKGHRLFATTGEGHEVAVVDLAAGKMIHSIPVMNPHAVVYRSDLDQIFVSDDDPAGPGLKIFDGRDYKLIKAVNLLKRTDSMGYDPATKYLYLVNGGKVLSQDYSFLSVIDSNTGDRVGEIKIPTGTPEDMYLDFAGPRLYIALMDKKQVGVVDRQTRAVVDTWPISKGTPVATAVDEAHHLLFVACRNAQLHGNIVVIDTQTGKEITSLPIGGLTDYMVFDPKNGRIYAVCSTAEVYVYQELKPDKYVLLGKPETALLARTGLLVPELNRFFVVAPNTGLLPAEVLVFQVH
jgi:DNA-binding beta-propeller fold protein YncE